MPPLTPEQTLECEQAIELAIQTRRVQRVTISAEITLVFSYNGKNLWMFQDRVAELPF